PSPFKFIRVNCEEPRENLLKALPIHSEFAMQLLRSSKRITNWPGVNSIFQDLDILLMIILIYVVASILFLITPSRHIIIPHRVKYFSAIKMILYLPTAALLPLLIMTDQLFGRAILLPAVTISKST